MTQLAQAVLVRLYLDSQATRRPTQSSLAKALGLPPATLRVALAELAQAGWVDAERVRLTLQGLVLATSLQARLTATGQAA